MYLCYGKHFIEISTFKGRNFFTRKETIMLCTRRCNLLDHNDRLMLYISSSCEIVFMLCAFN